MDEDYKEEWFKLVLTQLTAINEKHHGVEVVLSKIRSEQVSLINQVEDLKKDVEVLDHTLRGNGTPGLKTKVEILENNLSSMKDVRAEEVKSNTASKVAKIGAVGAGVVAFVKVVVDLLI